MGVGRECVAVMLLSLSFVVVACDREDADHASATIDDIRLAPGYGPLGFEAPEPGSYRLPPLGDAADGRVVSSDGSPVTLHEIFDDKVVIMSLMYASCSDVNGCPLATAVLHQIASRMEKEPELADGLRLLSLSFDPIRDTPAVMRQHASHHVGHGVDWQFLTTASETELRPILANYGQSLVPEIDEEGNEVGDISHVLRVFLIDSAGSIRNTQNPKTPNRGSRN